MTSGRSGDQRVGGSLVGGEACAIARACSFTLLSVQGVSRSSPFLGCQPSTLAVFCSFIHHRFIEGSPLFFQFSVTGTGAWAGLVGWVAPRTGS